MPKSTTAEKKPSARQVAAEILRAKGEPMPVSELCEQVNQRVTLGGKTPLATIAATLYVAAKKGEFVKTGRGMIGLPADGAVAPPEALPAKDADSDAEESPAVTPGSVVVRRGDANPDPKPTRRAPRKKTTAAA